MNVAILVEIFTCTSCATRRRRYSTVAGYRDEIGRGNIFEAKDIAISSIFERLDKDICATCEQRIFVECKSLPEPEKEKDEDKEE